MGKRIPVLDHGYIELIEHWGSDERIIEAARMSTGKGFQGWGPRCPHGNKFGECQLDSACASGTCETTTGDERLLKYLYENSHSTPFEMAGMVIEVQAPIMVFREWHRHRTQSYNELSARYTPLPDVNYLPDVGRCFLGVKGPNKQAGTAKGALGLTPEAALAWLEELHAAYRHTQSVYEKGLALGVPKELARLPVPVGRYSRMRASANLRNWLAFLTLRSTLKNPNAQWEIRQFADQVSALVYEVFPRTHQLFVGPFGAQG